MASPTSLPREENYKTASLTKLSIDQNDSDFEQPRVGRDHLSSTLPPHESYEGKHRWDPTAEWTPEEEARVVRKTDLYLLSWICLMVIALRVLCG